MSIFSETVLTVYLFNGYLTYIPKCIISQEILSTFHVPDTLLDTGSTLGSTKDKNLPSTELTSF